MSELPCLLEADELLHRQIHPNFIDADGRIMSLAFSPFPRDNGALSVDCDSCASATQSFTRFNASPGCTSAAVYSVACAECESLGLTAHADPVGGTDNSPANDCHALISGFSVDRKAREKAAKALRNFAVSRGQQHP